MKDTVKHQQRYLQDHEANQNVFQGELEEMLSLDLQAKIKYLIEVVFRCSILYCFSHDLQVFISLQARLEGLRLAQQVMHFTSQSLRFQAAFTPQLKESLIISANQNYQYLSFVLYRLLL